MEKSEINQTKWYETMTVKMVVLGFMAFVFLIPLQLIKIVIQERESSSEAVKYEISEKWGKLQTLSGPVLNVPVYRIPTENERSVEPVRKVWHILPEELNITGNVIPETRKRGIYETVIYESALTISGHFSAPESGTIESYNILWEEAYLTMGISDNRGLVNNISINLGDKIIMAEPGLSDMHLFQSGISFPVEIENLTNKLKFKMALGIRGSGGIYFTPMGKTTKVNLTSDWTDPSFNGKFLPATRTVDEEGFSAEWEVTNLNRNFPMEWIGKIQDITEEAFGVDLILGVDHYQKSERSAKYGLLFIAFTFLILLFIELSSDKKIHLFSYFLVSLALILFFSLLNALSEHIGFNPAYIVASAATIGLITGFSGSLLSSRKSFLIVGGLLTGLYIFLFFLLALNEYAYLVGNIGLFIGLAAIMRLTSKTEIFRKNEL